MLRTKQDIRAELAYKTLTVALPFFLFFSLLLALIYYPIVVIKDIVRSIRK